MTELPSSGVVLDTNVISEAARPRPEPRVMDFLRARSGSLWLPVVAIHEVEYGAFRLARGRRRDRLVHFVTVLERRYRGRMLDVTRRAAFEAARIRAEAERGGRAVQLADALIAGTARAASLGLATRNTRDFRGLGIELLNPWEIPRGG